MNTFMYVSIYAIYSNKYCQKWCLFPHNQQLFVFFSPNSRKKPPSEFFLCGVSAEEMDKVGFYSMLNFLLAQKPMAQLWLPKVRVAGCVSGWSWFMAVVNSLKLCFWMGFV